MKRLAGTLLCALLASGAGAADPGPARQSIAAAGTVEVAFSPWDDSEGLVIRAIESAREALLVQAYIFNSKRLSRALLAAQARGVRVEVLADHDKVREGASSQIPRLVEAGIPVLLEFRYQSAHNKVMLIDPRSPRPGVLTGSYNFTYAAHAKNAENLIWLRDNPELARAYFHNWLRHKAGAVPYAAAPAQPMSRSR